MYVVRFTQTFNDGQYFYGQKSSRFQNICYILDDILKLNLVAFHSTHWDQSLYTDIPGNIKSLPDIYTYNAQNIFKYSVL